MKLSDCIMVIFLALFLGVTIGVHLGIYVTKDRIEKSLIREGFAEYQINKTTGEISVLYKEKGIMHAVKNAKKSP